MKDQVNNPTEVVAATSIARLAANDSEISQPYRPVTRSIAPVMPTAIPSNTTVIHPPAAEQPSIGSNPSSSSSSTRYYKSPTLYAGDLHADVTEATLYDIFQALGPIQSIRVCRDRVNRCSLGYAYINFAAVQDAERALTSMNYFSGAQTFGKPLRLMWNMRDPSSRRQGEGNVFVKGLVEKIDTKALHDTFSQFGEILSCKVASDGEGASLGYGFVHFVEVEAAKEAIIKVNGMLLEGSKVHVGEFRRRQERKAAGKYGSVFTNVYVKHLTEEQCEEGELRDLFKAYGPITSVFVPRHKNGTPKRYAFVNFASSDMACRAVSEMHGRQIADVDRNDSEAEKGDVNAQGQSDDANKEGKRLFVCRAQKKSEREAELRKKFARIRREQAERQEGLNVYVKNLTPGIDSDQLRAHFATVGKITSCAVMRDTRGFSRGFGFVCFTTREEASKAVEQMNRTLLGSKQLYVAIAQRKEVRRARIRAQRYGLVPWMGTSAVMGAAGRASNLSRTTALFPPGAIFAQPNPYVYQHALAANMSGDTAAVPGSIRPVWHSSTGSGPHASPTARAAVHSISNAPATTSAPTSTRTHAPATTPIAPHAAGFPHLFSPHSSAPAITAPLQPLPHPHFAPFAPQFTPSNHAMPPQHLTIGAYPPLSAATTKHAARHHHRQDPVHYSRYSTQIPRGIHTAANNTNAQPVTHRHHRFVASPTTTAATASVAAPSLPSETVQHLEPLTIDILTAATPAQRNDMLGVRLYPHVAAQNNTLATKITGMLLELDDADLLHLIRTPNALTERVQEAEDVLREYAKSIAKEKANGKSTNGAQAEQVTQSSRANDSRGHFISEDCASSGNIDKAPSDVTPTVSTANANATGEPKATEKSS